MNKQQLASKIWESANKMRSKIEANEYKDYILGFIFYKFLSDRELAYLKKEGITDSEIKEMLNETQKEAVQYCQDNWGYFIAYDNLFSTWLDKGKEFNISDVREALSAFSRLISNNPTHKKVFTNIFRTLDTGLSKLGENSASQTKAVSDLLNLIKDIPMDGKQDYDTLGFIYEYLISNFASNAGKKAGEFYTPHEVSVLMAEIVANHIKDNKQENFEIYDPTSGSGSLLITIGKALSKYIDKENNIKYYAQELIESTYNLTRMNLVMRDIKPSNIVTRNGDTLEEDWPYFDDNDPSNTYDPLYVDAVVSNPPYSQQWNPENKGIQPRYEYGLAPASKADYAFLLHDLYHIKPDGIMTIVLPHGVLFRGKGGKNGEKGESEYEIRKNLIENNKIDAIIGLPPNIFFGTGIPTIIMVLKKTRDNNDVLIIDSSKYFTKVGKQNKLQASDIKRIVDVVAARKDVAKFSRKVSKEEIRNNDYNLNIPRYVDSSEDAENYDIYASVIGGIPKIEVEKFASVWTAFPSLKDELFVKTNDSYYELACHTERDNCHAELDSASYIKETVLLNKDVKAFELNYKKAFEGLDSFLKEELITKLKEINVNKEEDIIANNLFEKLQNVPLVDKYSAYQSLDDEWQTIANDLNIIIKDGFDAAKKVEEIKDNDDNVIGYRGSVIPFELIQQHYLIDEYNSFNCISNKITELSNNIEGIIEEFSGDEFTPDLLNEANDAFDSKKLQQAIKAIYDENDTKETLILKEYLRILKEENKKDTKISFIKNNSNIEWTYVEPKKDGTYGKTAAELLLKKYQKLIVFLDGSFESKLIDVSSWIEEIKQLKKTSTIMEKELINKTIAKYETLTDDEVNMLLEKKWITPLVEALNGMPGSVVVDFIDAITKLTEKYAVTLSSLNKQIETTQNELFSLMVELTGNDFDIKGLDELKKIWGE